mgnify:CR=1 FL=1
MKKRFAGVLALLFAMMTALTGCAQTVTLDNTAEVVNVDGVSIPMGELNFYLRYQQAQMQSFMGVYFGEDYMSQDIMGMGASYGETVRDTTTDTLVEYYLIEKNADDLGIALTDEDHAKIAEAVKAFMADNDSKTLELMSADEATATHVLELATLQVKAYANRAATIDTDVDEEQIAQKRISYVMTSTVGSSSADGTVTELTAEELAEKKGTMEAIAAEAKESGDLSAAAEANGLSATTLTYGKGDNTLNEAVLAAADQLSDGEVSAVIEDESGYFVVLMESTFDEDATEAERQEVLDARESEAYNVWYEPLKEAAQITKNDALIQTLTFERIFTTPAEG